MVYASYAVFYRVYKVKLFLVSTEMSGIMQFTDICGLVYTVALLLLLTCKKDGKQ